MALKTCTKKVNKLKQSAKGNNNTTIFLLPGFHKHCLSYPSISTEEVERRNKFCIPQSGFCVKSFLPTIMATYYPQHQLQQRHNYPIQITEWSPIVSAVQANNIYTSVPPVPIVLTTPQMITQICPYTGTLVAEPLLSSIISNTRIAEISPVVSNTSKPIAPYLPELNLAVCVDNEKEEIYHVDETLPPNPNKTATEDVTYENADKDPLEFYLTLPKELFPSARMFSFDPNPIIDEFCKMVNINDNAPWILDLEFGVPRVLITRAIAVYDIQFNSIHCKNTPGAIHPGFESCSSDFKRLFLFYYDCIVSTWYKGYIVMNNDKSVKNFQSWLQLPMQTFGMCWP